jgi:hypothetical protein
MNEIKYLSLAELAVRLNISYTRAVALHDAGCLTHDARVNHTLCFSAERVGELRRAVTDWGLAKATKARAAQLKN